VNPPSFRYERALKKKGFNLVCGIDEAGRGPLAGPVVAAAVIFPSEVRIKGLRDSKKLTPKKRNILYEQIMKSAESVGVGIVNEKVIDSVNIFNAAFLAMKAAILELKSAPDHIVVDGRHKIPAITIPQTAVVGGDDICSSVAAASIIAKVTRDSIMVKLDKRYPGFGFAKHKGYGTARHLALLKKKGPTPIHRRSYMPVVEALKS